MATNIVIVARSTVRAARLRVKSDRARGITPDPAWSGWRRRSRSGRRTNTLPR
jgi:hypothetical protein